MIDKEKQTASSEIKQASHHDVFFKEFYSNPQFALELFRLIFSPEEMKAYNWADMKIEKDTFKGKRAGKSNVKKKLFF